MAVGSPHQVGERTDPDMGLEGVPERLIFRQCVAVTPPNLVDHDQTCVDQIPDNQLHRPLSDPDPNRYIPHPSIRVERQAHQDVTMVRQQRPRGLIHQPILRELACVRCISSQLERN